MTIAEGTTTLIAVTLSDPIIAITPDPEVVLDLTIGDPTRVALSTNRIVFAATEWHTSKNFIVTALGNTTHDLTSSVAITGVVTSASEYYNGYQIVLTVNITDDDPVPTTTTPPTSTAPATTAPPTTATQPAAAPPAEPAAPTTEGAPEDEPFEPAPKRSATPVSPGPEAAPPSSTTTAVTTTTTTVTTTTALEAPASGAVPTSTPADPEVTAARTTTESDGGVSTWLLVTALALAAGAGGAGLFVRNRRSHGPSTP